MRMKRVGCPNHNLTHATRVKPSDSPTATTVRRPIIYQAGIASTWSQAAVEGAETHYICMKKI